MIKKDIKTSGKITARITGIIMITFLLISSLGIAQNWKQMGANIDGKAAFDGLGWSVSLSKDGTTIAVGAPQQTGKGYAQVYKFSSGKWMQIGNDMVGDDNYNFFGVSVSLSNDGSIVAVGASQNNDNGRFAGHVRVFQFQSGRWTQLGEDIRGEDASDKSGFSVSLSSDGHTVAIGAYQNSGNGNSSGHVRVYKYSSGQWEQLGDDINGEAQNDESGYSVSLSGDGTTVAIGAYLNDENGDESGHVRVFRYSSGAWTQVGDDINGETTSDHSGFSVSINDNGTIVAVGSPGNGKSGKNAGQVRVFEYTSGRWTQMGNDILGEAPGDHAGNAVSLSDDGLTLAVGAYLNDGTNGAAGHVRVYHYENNNWKQVGNDIDGEVLGDGFGYSVSLNSDGSIVAAGANYNKVNGFYSGHVRVFSMNPTGVEKKSEPDGISVFPLPNTGMININLGALKNVSLKVFNVHGQLVYHKDNINTSDYKFELQQPAGVYFIDIAADGITKKLKIIKK